MLEARTPFPENPLHLSPACAPAPLELAALCSERAESLGSGLPAVEAACSLFWCLQGGEYCACVCV